VIEPFVELCGVASVASPILGSTGGTIKLPRARSAHQHCDREAGEDLSRVNEKLSPAIGSDYGFAREYVAPWMTLIQL
jgi:hypothetical protein